MSTEDKITEKLRQASLSGGPWGSRGPVALERIESGLGVKLGRQLHEFVLGVGNLQIDPFNIIVAGDDAGMLSTLTQTRHLWESNPQLKARRAIQVMEHAGEVYLYCPESERICAYDFHRPVSGEETLTWGCFEQFLDWVGKEAEIIMNNYDFS